MRAFFAAVKLGHLHTRTPPTPLCNVGRGMSTFDFYAHSPTLRRGKGGSARIQGKNRGKWGKTGGLGGLDTTGTYNFVVESRAGRADTGAVSDAEVPTIRF